jgi:hypothetical protein
MSWPHYLHGRIRGKRLSSNRERRNGEMSLTACPAASVAAPVEVIWEILTQPAYYALWADAQVQCVDPEGPAVVGQTVHFTSQALGLRWPIVFKIERVNAERHQLGLYAVFPLGLKMRPYISCTSIDAATSRVQYG